MPFSRPPIHTSLDLYIYPFGAPTVKAIFCEMSLIMSEPPVPGVTVGMDQICRCCLAYLLMESTVGDGELLDGHWPEGYAVEDSELGACQ